MAVHTEASTVRGAYVPCRPSWMDHLVAGIDHLPGPAWLVSTRVLPIFLWLMTRLLERFL